jgi:hypothetical protein
MAKRVWCHIFKAGTFASSREALFDVAYRLPIDVEH